MKRLGRIWFFLTLGSLLLTGQLSAPSASAWYWCGGAGFGNPDDCWRDSDCNPGVCHNRQCKCGSDIESKPICADRCADRGYTGGGPTIHITDCRGIDRGDRGGVISYCFLPACSAGAGNSCSRSNSCGMTSSGTIQCDGSCSATAPPNAKCPSGLFSAADCSNATGTASDPDYTGASQVRIYDGVALQAPEATANTPKPKWLWTIPTPLKIGVAKSLNAYVQNVNGAGAQEGPWVPLPGNPKPILCDDPPTGYFTAVTCTSSSGYAEDSGGGSVPVSLYNGDPGAGGVNLGSTNATPKLSVPNWTVNYPVYAGFKDGDVHTLYLRGTNVPTGGAPVTIATAALSCPPDAPTNVRVSLPDYCSVSGPGPVTVLWNVTDHDAYRFQIAENAAFTVGVRTYDSTNPTALVPQRPWWLRVIGTEAGAAFGNHQIPSAWLQFGRTYYLRVSVGGNAVPADVTKWSPWSATVQFATPALAYPHPSFTPPEKIFAGVPALFTDTSTTPPLAPILSWLWELKQGTTVIQTSTDKDAKLTFPAEGDYTVTLSVTNAGGTCSYTGPAVNSGKGLPIFREVRPGSRPSPTPTSGANRP